MRLDYVLNDAMDVDEGNVEYGEESEEGEEGEGERSMSYRKSTSRQHHPSLGFLSPAHPALALSSPNSTRPSPKPSQSATAAPYPTPPPNSPRLAPSTHPVEPNPPHSHAPRPPSTPSSTPTARRRLKSR